LSKRVNVAYTEALISVGAVDMKSGGFLLEYCANGENSELGTARIGDYGGEDIKN
jgi:hypothetical protein